LRAGAREGGGRRARLRTGLTIAQAALSVVLLVGAGLFVRSFDNALRQDLGLDADAVLAVEMRWPHLPAPAAGGLANGNQIIGLQDAHSAVQRERAAFHVRALERVAALPGVEHAALSVGTPFHTTFGVQLRVPGRDSIPELPGGGPFISAVTPAYFATVGTRVLRGRAFEAGEGAGTEPVTVVNEPMARTLWPDGGALGRCILIGEGENVPCARVVGIVEESRRYDLREETAMQYYVPFGQEQGFGGNLLLVRPRGPNEAIVPVLRALLQELDADGGYVSIESLRSALDPQVRPWRLGTLLFASFGALALLIAAIGMYSVVAYGVAQRTREMGVRMVLGARRGDVRGLVLRQGAAVAAAGVALGLLMAFVGAQLARGLLFEVSPTDPLVMGVVSLLLIAVALLACWIPAVRATRVDPVVALRAD
jgi:predicted permease